MKGNHSSTDTKMSHPTKYKFKQWSIIHTSNKAKQLTHIYAKDDDKERKTVQLPIEIVGMNVNFVYQQKGSNTINKYNNLHNLHQSLFFKIPRMFCIKANK